MDNISPVLDLFGKAFTPVIVHAEPDYFIRVVDKVVRQGLNNINKGLSRTFGASVQLPFLPPLPALPKFPNFFGTEMLQIPMFNMFSLIGTPQIIEDLASIDGVGYVYPNRMNNIFQQSGIGDTVNVPPIDILKAETIDRFWTKGYKGQGTKTTVIDTGANMYPIGPGSGKNWEYYNAIPMHPPGDEVGHGSWCATRIAGESNTINGIQMFGFAPQTKLQVIKSLGFGIGAGSDDFILAGMQQAIKFGANVVSMSLGSSPGPAAESALCRVIEADWKNRMWMLSNGNSGLNPLPNAGLPGGAKHAIRCGSVSYLTWKETGELKRSFYSSYGKTYDGYESPLLVGFGGGRESKDKRPKELVLGNVARFGTQTLGKDEDPSSGMLGEQGTSMVAPNESSKCACAKSMFPDFGTEDVFGIMEDKGKWDEEVGYGLLTYEDIVEWMKR